MRHIIVALTLTSALYGCRKAAVTTARESEVVKLVESSPILPFLCDEPNVGKDLSECNAWLAARGIACDDVWPTRDVRGLAPAKPLALCVTDGRVGLLRSGCQHSLKGMDYLALERGQDGVSVRRATTAAELGAMFAPIDSDAEALAFVLATTSSHTVRGVCSGKWMKGMKGAASDVEKDGADFIVSVFASPYYCGCFTDDIELVRYRVTLAGALEQIDRTLVCKGEGRTCVD
jgi:hypothetical protein